MREGNSKPAASYKKVEESVYTQVIAIDETAP